MTKWNFSLGCKDASTYANECDIVPKQKEEQNHKISESPKGVTIISPSSRTVPITQQLLADLVDD